MRYIGIDLHKRFLVAASEDESGGAEKPQRLECQNVPAVLQFFETRRPFRAVIEASSSCR